MVKEEKNIDFYTTGRQPSEHEFAKISELIKNHKKRRNHQAQGLAEKEVPLKGLLLQAKLLQAGIRKSN